MKATKTQFLIVVAIALFARIINLIEIKDNPFFYHPIVDAWDYHKDAVEIVTKGDWIGRFPFFQAPLISYFLAVIYKIGGINLLLPRIVQAIMGALTAGGVYLIARLLCKRSGLVAGLIASFYPLFIFYDGEILPPTITIALDVLFFITIFYYACPIPSEFQPRPSTPVSTARVSTARWLIPGAIFGLRALATTNNLATLPAIWIWIAIALKGDRWRLRISTRATKSILAFTIATIAVIAPVTIRNYALSGKFILVSSNAGLNFYLGNSGDYQSKVGMRPGPEWDEFVCEHVARGLKVGPDMSGYFFRQSFDYIINNPAQYLKLVAYKSWLLLHGNEILRNQEIYAFRRYSSLLRILLWKIPGPLGLAFPFGILLPLAFPGLILSLRRSNQVAMLLAGYALLYAISVIAFFVTARYRLPIVVPLMVLASYGIVNFKTWWKDKTLRLVVLVGIGILYIAANLNVKPMANEMNPDAYYSLASTHFEQGDIKSAEHFYKKSLELDPKNAGAWVNLGLHVYETLNLIDQAMACYKKAIEVKPTFAPGYYNLARLMEKKGQPAQAKRLYLEAIACNPVLTPAYINLGYIELADKNLEQAYEYFSRALGIDSESVSAMIGLAIACFEKGDAERAIHLLQQAAKLEPENPDIYFNLALLQSKMGAKDLAAEAAVKAIQLNPADSQIYSLYVDCMMALGKARQAKNFLDSLIVRYPNLKPLEAAIEDLRKRIGSD